MNRVSVTALLVSACLFFGGCTPVPTKTEAIAGPGQSVEYFQGSGVLMSKGAETVMSASMFADGDRIKLHVIIENVSDHPIEFSEANVASTENGLPITAVTAEQQKREADRRDVWRRVAAGAAAGLNAGAAASAGRSTYSGSYTTTNQYGKTYTGTYVGQTYDPAAAQAAQTQAAAQNVAMVENVSNAHATEVQAISGELQRTTIHPGESIQGWVTLTAAHHVSKRNEIDVEISLGGEVHSLRFVETRG